MAAPAGLHVVRTPAEAGTSDAPPVVFVHGAMDRGSSFGRVARLLRDHEVVRYDRRGYGRSIELAPVDIATGAADLLAVLEGRPSVVFGHSIGGVLALAAAQRRPELVPCVVAYEAPMSWTDWWPTGTAGGEAFATEDGPGPAAERFLRRMIGDRRWERLPPRTREERRAEGPALVADVRSLRLERPPYDATRLSMPVLAACGSASSAHHRRAAHELADAAPLGELHEVPGADHGAHLTHPRALAELVHLAVARVGGGPGPAGSRR